MADCAGTTIELNAPEVTAGDGPLGWPGAVVASSKWAPRLRGPGSVAERAAFTAFQAEKIASRRPVFAATDHVGLSRAYAAALDEWDRMAPKELAHAVADQFCDADDREREEAWLDARDEYDQKLEAILKLQPTSPAMALEKVVAFYTGQGIAIDADSDASEVRDFDDYAQVAAGALWRDMRALAPPPPPVIEGSAAELTRRYEEAAKAFNAADYEVEAEEVAAWEAVNDLYEAACDAPLQTKADAAAKVRLGLIGFRAGEREDGRDVAVLEQAAAWLGAV